MSISSRIAVWLAVVAITQFAIAAEPEVWRHAPPRTPALRLAQVEPPHATDALMRKIITDMQRGTLDAASFEPTLYAAIQAPGGPALVERFGALQRIEPVASPNGANVYRVTFDKATMMWSIRMSPAGRIAGLSFTPVEGPAGEEVATAGLSGTLLKPAGAARSPVVLLIAGSGPTDRDGNQGGMRPAALRELAEALAERGIASLRYDKRGIGRSVVPGLREQDVVLDTFVDDAAAWVKWLQQRPDLGPPIIAGHSEGGVIALALAKRMPVPGIVLIATPGRPLGDVLREQLQRNGMPAPLLSEALAALAALERGETVSDVNPKLAALFRPSVQPFMRSMLAVDPARELGSLKLPVMIVSGGHDLQVGAADAALLAKAREDAVRLDIPDMNHVLKITPADRAGQMYAYLDAMFPLAPGLGDAIAAFVRRVAQP